MINLPDEYQKMTIREARKAVVKKIKKTGKLKKEESLQHKISLCYRCGTIIEPLLLPQWYIKIKPLAEKAIQAVREKKVKFFPSRFKKEMLRWLKTAPDWNISRQIVWGSRIPAWYCLECNPQIEISFLDTDKNTVRGEAKDLLSRYKFKEIKKGLQNLTAPLQSQYQLTDGVCRQCQSQNLLQETDTFDTWFSSGQWPFAVLDYPDGRDFQYFYPTSLIDTMWDILPFWIVRMLMLGLYRANRPPFQWVHLHARVVDTKGKKMSKSRGNVVNPLRLIEKYGADALRISLVHGVSPASNVPIGNEKLKGMRNFTNKLWNIGRFIKIQMDKIDKPADSELKPADKRILKTTKALVKSTTENLDSFRLSDASLELYDFTWNKLANEYMEAIKDRLYEENDKAALQTLIYVYTVCLKLLHPFVPFVTEAVWQELFPQEKPLIISPWPKPK